MAQKRSAKRQEKLSQRRKRAAQLFERGFTQAEVAHELGVSRVSAMRWHRAWERGGSEALKPRGPLGRPPRLSKEQLDALRTALLAGPRENGFDVDTWTAPRVADLIDAQFGVTYHPGHVWRVLRALGWTLQRPTTRARERDEDAIHTWVHSEFPRLKKGRQSAQRSSS